MPVTPGTKFVTLGGAVANDVHGKNHESAGTIGCYVRRIGLARSSGEVIELSETDNAELFQATIGGLGLTGLMLWVELALKKIESAIIDVETLAIADLDHFFRLAEESADWEHTVAWVDCLATGKRSAAACSCAAVTVRTAACACTAMRGSRCRSTRRPGC